MINNDNDNESIMIIYFVLISYSMKTAVVGNRTFSGMQDYDFAQI